MASDLRPSTQASREAGPLLTIAAVVAVIA